MSYATGRAARRVLNGIAMGSGDRSPVASRCDAELPDEGTCHVALIGEARSMRRIGWRPACRQEPPDEAHSPLDEIGVRCRPHFAGETAQELEPAYAR